MSHFVTLIRYTQQGRIATKCSGRVQARIATGMNTLRPLSDERW